MITPMLTKPRISSWEGQTLNNHLHVHKGRYPLLGGMGSVRSLLTAVMARRNQDNVNNLAAWRDGS